MTKEYLASEIKGLKRGSGLSKNNKADEDRRFNEEETIKLIKFLEQNPDLPGLEIATHWSPMRPKIECWQLDLKNWSPAAESRFV